MFFGTSAKTYLACAPDAATVNAPTARMVLISSFFIGSILLVDLHCVRSETGYLAVLLRKHAFHRSGDERFPARLHAE
jgi:hypothetical protein